MVDYIIIHNQKVTCCDECPRNKAFPNPIWNKLPESHYCIDVFDPMHKEGKPITFSRYKIADWCPHVGK